MYRKLIYSIFIVSIGCNIYCGFNYYQRVQERRWADAVIGRMNVQNVSTKDGDDFLLRKIKDTYPDKATKKYYFVSIWNVMCGPCVKEMPLLDSLADNINRKDVGYLFVTENGDKMINQFVKRRNISSRNFGFINDADTYISSVLKSHHLETRQYPIQLIIDNTGDVKYFQIGAFESSHDSTVMTCMKGLKE